MNDKYWMYLSLWDDHGGQPGLVLLAADAGTGEAELRAKLDDRLSFGCSFVDEARGILYLCNEVDKVRDVPYETGRIYAYRINRKDGSLTELFHQETCCPNPAYVSQDPSGRFLVVAHHSMSGGIAKLERTPDGHYAPTLINRDAPLIVYALRDDGTIQDIVDVQKHPVDPASKPYGSLQHCCVFSPDGGLVAVCDKGDGHIYLYSMDRESGKMTLRSRTQTDIPGSHPRYCVFHPTKPYLIVNHEQEWEHRMAVTSFRYSADGQLEKVSAVNLLEDGEVIPPRSHYEQQGLAISGDGHTVYTCVNGPNYIGVLALEDDGTLKLVQRAPVSGEWPRGLALAPGGRFLFASCLVSGDVYAFPVRPDGSLEDARPVANQRGGAYFGFCRAEG